MQARRLGSLILLCLLVLGSVTQARADVIVARPLDTSRQGQYSNLGPGTHQQVADPFSLLQSMTLESLLWYGRYDQTVTQTDVAFSIRLIDVNYLCRLATIVLAGPPDGRGCDSPAAG